jgi:hypothetical protein
MADVLKPNPESLKPDAHDGGEELVLPSGWMYKQFKIGSFQLPWYASPPAQLLLVAVVCFMCPGMFNALKGMGGVCSLETLEAMLMRSRLANLMRPRMTWQTRLSTPHSRSSVSSRAHSQTSLVCG